MYALHVVTGEGNTFTCLFVCVCVCVFVYMCVCVLVFVFRCFYNNKQLMLPF